MGAILHPKPTRALVVGLGTGSSAGWLGSVPFVGRVDVVEMEPAVLEVARACAPVNRDVLANPKVHIVIGDAREVLLTTRERYDIIFSEPSNPYRAGVSSLFSQEFYQAVAARLAEGGLFTQWIQAYEVDGKTLRTAYATLASVFPVVETWETEATDLLLVGSLKPVTYDAAALAERVAQEPFKTALAAAWRATSLEGFMAHYVADASLAKTIAEKEGTVLSTDDVPLMEFAFARTVGRGGLFDISELVQTARARKADRPQLSGGYVNWKKVEDERVAWATAQDMRPNPQPGLSAEQMYRLNAQRQYVGGNLQQAVATWRAQPSEPSGPTELLVLAAALAGSGDETARPYIDRLRIFQPAEADALLARLRWNQGQPNEATDALEAAFRRYQHDPWPLPTVMGRAIDQAVNMTANNRALAARLYQALKTPFAVAVLNDKRLNAVAKLARYVDLGAVCVDALAPMEPHVPWRRDFLVARLSCYEATNHPLKTQAKQDLDAFVKNEPVRFGTDL